MTTLELQRQLNGMVNTDDLFNRENVHTYQMEAQTANPLKTALGIGQELMPLWLGAGAGLGVGLATGKKLAFTVIGTAIGASYLYYKIHVKNN